MHILKKYKRRKERNKRTIGSGGAPHAKGCDRQDLSLIYTPAILLMACLAQPRIVQICERGPVAMG
jgi:hypothetical protein